METQVQRMEREPREMLVRNKVAWWTIAKLTDSGCITTVELANRYTDKADLIANAATELEFEDRTNGNTERLGEVDPIMNTQIAMHFDGEGVLVHMLCLTVIYLGLHIAPPRHLTAGNMFFVFSF